MKHTSRAVLAVALLLGFYVYGVVVIVGLGWVCVLAIEHGLPGILAGKAFLVLAIAAVAVLGSVFSLRRRAPAPPPGLLLTPALQPRLWGMVHDLARRVGTRPPDEIRLVPDVNAAVAEEAGWLGLRPGVRRMFVGAPLLTTFSEAELASVLAHELGHYSGRHTALGGLVYRSRDVMGTTLERLQDHPVVSAVFRLYARRYIAVTAATSRAQELEADRLAVEVAGPSTATRALLSIEPLAAAWTFFLETYALAGSEDGLRPTDVFGGFEMFLSDPERQQQLVDLALHAPPRAPHWTDTHPPVDERVRAMESLGLADVTGTSAPAVELLGDYLAVLRALEDEMFSTSGLRPAGWDEVVGAGARRTWDHLTGLVATPRDATAHEGSTTSLSTVGDGRFRGYVAEVLVDPHAHASEAERELLDALCRSALVAGGAHVRVNWAGPAHVVGHRAQLLDPRAAGRDVLDDPAGVGALRDWLVTNGASLDHEPQGPQTEVERRAAVAAGPPELLAVVGPVTCRGMIRLGGMCFVLTSGVVLRPPTLRERWAVGLGMGHGSGMVRVASRLSAEEVSGHPKARHVAWETVRHGRAASSWGNRRVLLSLTDGRELKIKFSSGTRENGELVPLLAHFLGDRFES